MKDLENQAQLVYYLNQITIEEEDLKLYLERESKIEENNRKRNDVENRIISLQEKVSSHKEIEGYEKIEKYLDIQLEIKEKIKVLERKKRGIKDIILNEEKEKDYDSIYLELKKEREYITSKLKERKDKESRLLGKIKILEAYLSYLESKKDYDMSKEEHSILIEKYKHYLTFEAKIIEAEGTILNNAISSINIVFQEYLERFFSNNLYGEISTTKELKNKSIKQQINLRLYSNEMEIETESLSGGEFDRVQLALTLAFSDVLTSSPLLFLDETLSSLDSNTTENVMNVVREVMIDRKRLIIFVLHQTTKGVFDDVLELI
jgi:DNA repair exonuclease SbcCD ATPase subunit